MATADLSSLRDLTEDAILAALADRMAAEQIYTAVGAMLIAINPCKQARAAGRAGGPGGRRQLMRVAQYRAHARVEPRVRSRSTPPPHRVRRWPACTRKRRWSGT